jgi:hypothetical protein
MLRCAQHDSDGGELSKRSMAFGLKHLRDERLFFYLKPVALGRM